MNKKTKIILIIMAILILLLLGIYLVLKFDVYVLKITETYNNINVTGRNKDSRLYMFYSPDMIIKNFKQIDVSELEKEDIIFVVSQPPPIITQEAYTRNGESVEKITNVRLVIVL